jgi:drug/metabolite transporter (DMT)-like permease
LLTITASLSVLLWALEPVLILLLAALVLRERIPPGLAVTVAVAGALYTVLTRRLMLNDSSLTVVLAQQVAALVFAIDLRRSSS